MIYTTIKYNINNHKKALYKIVITKDNKSNEFKSIIIKNGPNSSQLFKDIYTFDTNILKQFQIELNKYGGINKLFNDIKKTGKNHIDTIAYLVKIIW